MLESAALPILLKAVNFLFDECEKILHERRERRKQKDPPKIEPLKAEEFASPPKLELASKAAALKTPIDRALWMKSEEQVAHLLSLLDIHLGNYRLLSKQYATWTEALVPPVVANSLKHEENKILEISLQLQSILSEAYAKEISIVKPGDVKDE